MLHKAWNSKGEMPYRFPRSSVKFQGHTVQNITDFDPNWAFPDYRPVAAFKSLRFALFIYRLQVTTAMEYWTCLPQALVLCMTAGYSVGAPCMKDLSEVKINIINTHLRSYECWDCSWLHDMFKACDATTNIYASHCCSYRKQMCL